MSNFFCYDDDPLSCQELEVNRLRAVFRNSILFGSRRDQILLSDYSGRMEPNMFDVELQNCVVRVDRLLTDNQALYADFFESYCSNCVDGESQDPLFLDTQADDYHLDTLSIAQDIGLILPGLDLDLDGKPRDEMPDAGCFERE